MPVAAPTLPLRPLDSVKMEERKRPATDDSGIPPSKRQAVTVNGASSHGESDLPLNDDLEVSLIPFVQIRERLSTTSAICIVIPHPLTSNRIIKKMPYYGR